MPRKVNYGKHLRQLDKDEYRERVKRQIQRHIVVEETTGCWKWTAWKLNNGYGASSLYSVPTTAHRASFFAYKGDIGEGLEVCHSCDVRDCVNPDHLFLGTHQENMLDMKVKQRIPSGFRNPNSKAVWVKGTVYGSIREAERILSVAHGTVKYYIRKGTAKFVIQGE